MIYQWIRNRTFFDRTFGLVNQDDSPERKKIVIFFNMSLLMAGLYSFLYLYKAFFIVIVLSGQCSSYLLFFSRFSSSSVPGNFLFSGLPGTAFLFHFNWNIFMKSYAGNWQINHNSRNRMSKKILSERIPLDGQWNNRTSPTWPETRHGREGRSRTSFFFLTKLTKSNDRAIPDNRSWNPRGFIGPAVIYRTCPMVFRFHWYMLKPVEA